MNVCDEGTKSGANIALFIHLRVFFHFWHSFALPFLDGQVVGKGEGRHKITVSLGGIAPG